MWHYCNNNTCKRGEILGNLKNSREKSKSINGIYISSYIPRKCGISTYTKIIDIYITPYLDPQQSASGALAYAIGAGKICISTPYLYAKEVLANNRGIIVPFRNSQAIADAVLDISKNPQKKSAVEKKAYKFGRLMTWHNVALQHLELFDEVIYNYKKMNFNQYIWRQGIPIPAAIGFYQHSK